MSAVSRKVNSPQWKNFQPPAVQDPAILSYQRVGNMPGNSVSSSPPTGSQNVRETGIIEKLLHSYGFVQCCDRESRLFFHYSEYNGDMDAVKTGDSVEFQLSYDRRTGRPIACDLIKIDPSLVSCEILSEERYHGSVVQEAKPAKPKNGCVGGSTDGLGRVTYEHNGECFFLPYGLDDVVDDGNTHVKPGDQVTFFIATDKRNGNLHARKLEPVEAPMKLLKYRGVVCSMKDTFGFLERADTVKEIFFHYSEYMGNINELLLGDDVEFEIQTRNGKEVATNITPLPEGTVVFEDVSVDKKKGKIQRTLKSSRRMSDPLGGKIQYENSKGGLSDIPYGDKDQKGEYTLQQGDGVEFCVATDRRDKLQRATQITLLKETFETTTERREVGIVVGLKEGFGFIQCAERDARMFFHNSELLDSSEEPKLQDEVEFTVTQDPGQPSRQVAIRIRSIPKGSVGAVVIKAETYIGTIEREPPSHRSPGKGGKDSEGGSIVFDFQGAIQRLPYFIKDIADLRNVPRFGDKVDFNIGEVRRIGGPVKMAVKIRVVLRNITGKCQGFVATLKDNYGFIENADHDKEVFFHFSSFEGSISDLDLGDEVEYTLARKSAKLSAESIRKLPNGTIPKEEIVQELGVLQGKIVRPMRIVNPDQEEYCGLVQVGTEDTKDGKLYAYGITSLTDKRDFLQKGDSVRFQVAAVKASGEQRAVNIAAVRKYVRARVDSIKDKYGFLNYEAEEGKKLFFHMTECQSGDDIQPSDYVEFVVVQNQRNGKYSACSVKKISNQKKRPERLLSRLKSMNDMMIGPRVVVIRPPKGPDGSHGFTSPRLPWQPPA